MREQLSRRVCTSCKQAVTSRAWHEPAGDHGVFSIRLPGGGFGLEDFKTLARTSEDFGLGLKLDDEGWITLS
jgi:hypothetical protein